MTDVFLVSLAWVLMSLAALAIGIYSIIEAKGDEKALLLSGRNGARRIVATAALRAEYVRAGIQLIFLYIGVGSMMNPTTPTARAPLAYMLTVAVAGILLNSYYGLLVRRRVIIGSNLPPPIKVAEQETLLEVQQEVGVIAEKATEVQDRLNTLTNRADVSEDRADAAEKREGQ